MALTTIATIGSPTVWFGGIVVAPVLLPDGTAAAPSLAFSGDAASGVYRNGTSLAFATAGVGRWQVDANGHLIAVTDNTYDIGASGATRPRNVFVAGTLAIGGATTLSAALTYGGVALSNAVTGTGNMVLSAGPTFSTNLILSSTTASIIGNTADAADNQRFLICAGGAVSQARGGYITLAGNENAATGQIDIEAGNITGAHIDFRTGSASRLKINHDGTVVFNATPVSGITTLAGTGAMSGFTTIANTSWLKVGGATVQTAATHIVVIPNNNFYAAQNAAGNATHRMLALGTDDRIKIDTGAVGTDFNGLITVNGSVTTSAPSGGTAGAWKMGVAAVVSPTSPNRTIELDIGGTIYYIHAKTTNN